MILAVSICPLSVVQNLSIIYCLRDVGSELSFKIHHCQFTFNESFCVVLRTKSVNQWPQNIDILNGRKYKINRLLSWKTNDISLNKIQKSFINKDMLLFFFIQTWYSFKGSMLAGFHVKNLRLRVIGFTMSVLF